MYLRHTRCGFHNNIQLLATSSSVAASLSKTDVVLVKLLMNVTVQIDSPGKEN